MPDTSRIAVILPAAGAGTRYAESAGSLGGVRSKLDEDLGGRPVLQRTVELFNQHDMVAAIVVAGPHEDGAYNAFRDRHADKLGLLGARICRGGVTHRYETVAAALAEVPGDATHIAVHDAARPCTPAEVIERVFEAAARHDAVVPGVEVSDTIKRGGDEVEEDEEADPLAAILGAAPTKARPRIVRETLERRGLFAIQTPQVFEASLLRRAYAQEDLSSTDDAGLVERLGERVVIVPGDVRNIKITRAGDVAVARAIMGVKGPQGRETHKRF
ncbi:MAG: IspD/TarI family cytidylyltransferase [Phycisphaerales bacterium]